MRFYAKILFSNGTLILFCNRFIFLNISKNMYDTWNIPVCKEVYYWLKLHSRCFDFCFKMGIN